MLQHPLRADDPRAAPIGLSHIHLRPLHPDSLGGVSGSFFALKDAKHSRAAAGHQGSDSAVLFQRGLDGLVVSGTAASSSALPAAAHTPARSPARIAFSWASQSGWVLLPTLS